MADIKERLAKDKEARDKAVADAEKRMASGKPTPTQEENDRARLGEPVEKKEDDGSGPDPHVPTDPNAPKEDKESKPSPSSGSGGSYQTRQHKPAT
jgi:hypothetical protein